MKRVDVASHGPLASYPQEAVGWEDVWLRVCSGKLTLRLAPCLVSREHLRSDIALYKTIADDPEAETREYHRVEGAKLEAILAEVDARGVVIGGEPTTVRRARHPGRDFSLADVYSREPWIDRAEAERMLDVYLGVLGLRGCVYKWKRPSLVVWPVTTAA